MVAFSLKLCDFVDLFFIGKLHKSSFFSMVVNIKIIPQRMKNYACYKSLVKKTSQENKSRKQVKKTSQVNKSYAQPPGPFRA